MTTATVILLIVAGICGATGIFLLLRGSTRHAIAPILVAAFMMLAAIVVGLLR